jgi:hypothetical protein
VRGLLLFALVAACGGDDAPRHGICVCDAPTRDAPMACDVLAQTGCQAGWKCSWIIDATTPQYVGHTGCVPDGTAQVGAGCEFGAAGASGYDNCAKGSVCSGFGTPMTPGVCEPICDPQGGSPTCEATHACVAQPELFSTGATSPAAAGVCVSTCDPFADNDLDGSGSAFSRTGTACGSANIGCYGLPSNGNVPKTTFTCMIDVHYGTSLVHRTECTSNDGCADLDGKVHANSCNQGYEPMLNESTAVTTLVCVALCKPLDCYAGSCGSNNTNRLGAAPHRCASSDAVGAFGSDEECQYLWAHELNNVGQWLPSAYSDSVGICVDHAAYGSPSCKDVPLHGNGSVYDAVSLGCVSSQTAGL